MQTLRAQLQSQELLEEQILSLNRKVERHEQLRMDVASFQAKTTQLNKSIDEWHSMAAAVLPGAVGPAGVEEAIKELQREQLVLTAKFGQFLLAAPK